MADSIQTLIEALKKKPTAGTAEGTKQLIREPRSPKKRPKQIGELEQPISELFPEEFKAFSAESDWAVKPSLVTAIFW